MKVIFLDIDGVLNLEVYHAAFWDICKRMELKRPDAKRLFKEQMRDEYGNLFCPLATRKLEWIIKETGAKIVISSSWRSSGLKIMQEMWKHRGLAGEVIDVTPVAFRLPNLPFADRLERGNEIKNWLEKHPEVEKYVIFDDYNDMLPEQLPYFIQTDEQYGITTNDAVKAIQILGNQ